MNDMLELLSPKGMTNSIPACGRQHVTLKKI